MVLEKTLESPLDCKEIQPVHSEEDQPGVFFGRNDAKAETPVLWPLHAKSLLKPIVIAGNSDGILWLDFLAFSSVQFSSVAQSCPTLCDPMNRSTPGLPVHHRLPEFTQTHVHRVRDAIQPSRMDWLDLLAVQGTLKSLLQHHTSKALILRRSAFFTVHLSHPYMTTGKTIAQKTKIMASGPITSWEIDGETVETVSDFILGGLQNHCRW